MVHGRHRDLAVQQRPPVLIAEQALVGLLGLLACLAGGVLASYTRARPPRAGWNLLRLINNPGIPPLTSTARSPEKPLTDSLSRLQVEELDIATEALIPINDHMAIIDL